MYEVQDRAAESNLMRRYVIIGGATVLYFIDRSLKSWAAYTLPTHGFFVSLGHLENSDGVFSTPVPRVVLLIGASLALLFLVGLAEWAWQRGRLLMLTGASLMLVGGFSNLFDRLWGAGVIDMFQLPGGLSFNLADTYLLAGLVLLVL